MYFHVLFIYFCIYTIGILSWALTEAMKYLPPELRKTLTYDRGREMAEHKILEQDLGIEVYFCDPHSPWQKGSVENMNGLIRQYLPKGIDLSFAD